MSSIRQNPVPASSPGELPELSQRLGRSVGFVFRRWRRMIDNEFREDGFSDATRGPLITLYDNDGAMQQRDLARDIGLEPSALVRVVALLEERGLVSCSPSPEDRRSKLVSLTPDGKAWAEHIIARSFAIEQRLLDGISPEELAVTRSVLARIGAALPDG